MSAQAAYGSSVLSPYPIVVASAANTNYDGTGTIVVLFTAPAGGARVDSVGWAAQGSTTAGKLNFFVRASSSDTWRFLFGTDVPAITVSATVAPYFAGATGLAWILPAGAQIGMAPTKAESFMAHVSNGGSF